MSEDDADSRPLRDDMAFNDPAAWGFCEMCAYDVAVTKGERIRIEHRRIRNGHEDTICSGSNKEPVMDTPAHATPRKQITLRKTPQRSQSRAHWQRRRWYAREQAEADAAIFHNEASPIMQGPIILEQADGDHYD